MLQSSEQYNVGRARELLGPYASDRHSNKKDTIEAYKPEQKITLFSFADLDTKKARRFLAKNAVIFCFLCVPGVLFRFPAFFIVPIGFAYLRYSALNRLALKRASNFESDYTALLLSLASGVKTGIDPLQALLNAKELFKKDSEVRKELLVLSQRLDSGKSEEEAISRFGETIRHPDIALFRVAFILARKEGSSLGKSLERLVRVTRNRQSFRRKVTSAVAMQRLSAYGIGGMAILMTAFQFVMNKKAFLATAEHSAGMIAMVLGTGFLLVGLLWMMNMAKARV